MERRQATYQVYVLRMWQEQDAAPGRPAVWRLSLEDPRTRQRRAFQSVDEMGLFLDARAGGRHDERINEEV